MARKESKKSREASELDHQQLLLDGKNVPVGYVSLDSEGRVLDVNPKWYEILGYSRDEVQGKWFGDFASTESQTVFRDHFPKFLREGEILNLELKMVRKDTRCITVLFNGVIEKDPQGQIKQTHCFLHDVTDVFTAQAASDRDDGRFKELFQHMSSCVAVYAACDAGEDFVLVDFNRAAERAEKISRAEILGKSVLEVFPGIKEFGLFDVFQRVWRTGDPEHHPIAQYRDERISGWRENVVCRLPSDELIVIYEDVTAAKQAEVALRESEARSRVVALASREGIWQLDLTGQVTFVSPAVESLFGYEPDEVGKLGFAAFFPEHELPREAAAFAAAVSGVAYQVLEFDGLHKDGSLIPIEVTVTPIVKDGIVTGVQGIARNIAERMRSQAEIVAARQFLNNVIESSPFAMWVADPDGTIIRTNHALREILGLIDDQIVGIYNIFEDENLLKQGVMPQVRAVFDKLEPTQFSISWQAEDGGSREFANAHSLHLDASMFPIIGTDGQLSHVVCQWVDVTQRVQARQQLEQSERSIQRKLRAILSPNDVEVGDVDLKVLLDAEVVQSLMEDFYATTQIGIAILNNQGEILVSTGWQDICTKFHRVHPETLRNCFESDTELTQGVEPGTFKLYRCKNQMWDMSTPILVEGRRVGNLFLGQFLFDDEMPAYEVFREQARLYGFDEMEYLAALDRVPRWRRETVQAVMSFYTKLASLLSESGYRTIRLARSLAQQEALTASLQESKDQYQQLVENLNDAVFVLDTAGRFTYVSPVAKELTGYEIEELVGRSFRDVIAPEDLPEVERSVAFALQGASERIEFRFLMKDGTKRWSRASSRPSFKEGRIMGITGVFSDISERRRAQDELGKSEATYRNLLSNLSAGVVVHSPDTSILIVNPAAQDLLGLSEDQLLGREARDPYWRFLRADGSEMPLDEYPVSQVLSSTEPLRDLVVGVRRSQAEDIAWLLVNGFSVLNDSGECKQALITFVDITKRKVAEVSLQENAKRLRSLASRLETLQEEERRQLSRELHDQVGQTLTALAMRISGTLDALRSGRDTALLLLDGSQDLVDDCIQSTRNVMANLRPSILDDYGLAAALSSHETWFRSPATLQVIASVHPLESRLPAQTETAFFRIAQEALTNVHKHAQATEVRILLEETDGQVVMTVADDGVGFDTEVGAGQGAHWGQLIMRERAEAVGGKLTVRSLPGQGCEVCVEVRCS